MKIGLSRFPLPILALLVSAGPVRGDEFVRAGGTLHRAGQTILGFGCAMSELSHAALWHLDEAERAKALDGIFSKDGAAFTVLRTPIGASDFALKYYSYDDEDRDFEMRAFSIANDEKTLLPLIREAQRRVPSDELVVWASPWCPPKWMKRTGRYASCQPWDAAYANDCPPERSVKEGQEGFVLDPQFLAAYALYFRKYVDAYRRAGVPIAFVMPQNEPSSAQPYPSCLWTAPALANFVGGHLGPALEGSGTDIWWGTVERPADTWVETPLTDAACRRYVKGMGFQWAGKDALVTVHRRHPDVPVIGSEQECGDGRNDAKHARHAWELVKHYFRNGVTAYEYWNLALFKDEPSTWGWHQNSLVVVDRKTRKWEFTREYAIMKALSHNVRRGARFLLTDESADSIAFANPDGTLVVLTGAADGSVTVTLTPNP